MVISETKVQGWRSIPPYPVKERQRYINFLTLAAFLFSSHPKRERDLGLGWPSPSNYKEFFASLGLQVKPTIRTAHVYVIVYSYSTQHSTEEF